MGESDLIPLLLVTTLAVIVPILAGSFKRMRVPVVVLEILGGIIIGKSGLHLIHPTPTLTFLADFGFAYLMFLAGLEVDFDLLLPDERSEEPFYRNSTFLGAAVLVLTLLLAMGAGFWLKARGLADSIPLMGLILSTTSMGIVVPVLKERRLIVSPYGQALLVAALLADFVTLILIGIVVAFYERGLSLDILLVSLLGVVFALLARLGHWLDREGMLQRFFLRLAESASQVPVRLALAFLVAWEVLAEALGVEVILGSFLAGALIGLLSKDHNESLLEKLEAMGYGFFIPIFFISVGTEFDLQSLLASSDALLLVPILVVLAYAVKLVPALLYRLRFTWRESVAAGFLLSSRLSLIIATSSIALELGLISEATNSAIILVAVVTCTLSPFLFNRTLPEVEEVARKGVLIIGGGDLAAMLAWRLYRRGEPCITILARRTEKLESSLPPHVRVLRDEPTEPQVLASAEVGRCQALIAASTDEEVNVAVARLAREEFGVPNVIAVVRSPTNLPILHALGARGVQPALALMLAVEGALYYPGAFDLLATGLEKMEFEEVTLHNAALFGRELRDVPLPRQALVMGIRRGDEVIVPHGNTKLHYGDRLILVGPQESVEEARLLVEESH